MLLLAVVASIALAAQSPSPDKREQVQAQLDAARTRLALTDAQRAQVEPILRAGIERRMTILQKHGILDEHGRPTGNRPSVRTLRGIRREFDDVRDDVTAQLAPILSPSQLAEYKKMQEEAKDALRERARERKSG